ncbi:hypothetical protein C8R45DRAFT_926974 [Mycena sanguinolenta]|nr:hypothetical protein C8R45DRAFT_926974 [Mycena sanguinolenta]
MEEDEPCAEQLSGCPFAGEKAASQERHQGQTRSRGARESGRVRLTGSWKSSPAPIVQSSAVGFVDADSCPQSKQLSDSHANVRLGRGSGPAAVIEQRRVQLYAVGAGTEGPIQRRPRRRIEGVSRREDAARGSGVGAVRWNVKVVSQSQSQTGTGGKKRRAGTTASGSVYIVVKVVDDDVASTMAPYVRNQLANVCRRSHGGLYCGCRVFSCISRLSRLAIGKAATRTGWWARRESEHGEKKPERDAVARDWRPVSLCLTASQPWVVVDYTANAPTQAHSW